MSRICRECKKGTLKICGFGYYGDTIEVECQNPECGEIYEVEPDGFGEGGMEEVEAYEVELERASQGEADG